MIDIINSEKIFQFLNKDLKNKINIEVYEKVSSTNTKLRERAKECEEGLVIVAGEQTAGKGRLGRSFFSPGRTGLYISVLLKPEIKPQDAIMITTAAAVAVCDALEKAGAYNPQIKWVNDIFFNDKKVCGILTEASLAAGSGMLEYAVLGVGINMYEPDCGFPSDIKDIAGAIFSKKIENLRNRVVAYFLNSFMEYYNNLSKKIHLPAYAEKCFVLGKEINVISGDIIRTAKALSLDENCGLCVEFTEGERAVLSSGEISIKVK